MIVILPNDSLQPFIAVAWKPVFTGYNGQGNVQVSDYKFLVGTPECGPIQQWPIYHYPDSADKLVLLPDGKMRHYIKDPDDHDDTFHVKHLHEDPDTEQPMYYDYESGQYCMDKAINSKDGHQAQYAVVCNPERAKQFWTPDFVIRKIVNPVCHGISIIILLLIAIVYFVLPTLRCVILWLGSPSLPVAYIVVISFVLTGI